MSLQFRNQADLVHWLTTTAPGRQAMQLADPGNITRVLIKAHGDGWIEVYGPYNAYAKIIGLPHSLQREREVERYVDASLPYKYKDLHCPGNLLVTEKVRYGIGFHEFMQRESNTSLDLAFIEGCQHVQDLQPGWARTAGDQGPGQRPPLSP